jgi:mannose-6-phosphate isomerase
VEHLHNPIRDYAWGSRSVLAQLQGRPSPSPGPEAELWIGAHPGSPSTVDGVPLDQLIAAAPSAWLGGRALVRFGPRLPYLLKVLAAEAPLSLQAHPDAARARERFAAGDPNYVDGHHKPELLVALTPFEALCGFRPVRESAAALAALGLDEAAAAVGRGDLATGVRLLLGLPRDRVVAISGGGLTGRLAAAYPGDPGALVALLLNHVTLQPGEAIWMPAGNLHAYLRGVGVEIMAASDNVLRGGLTPKRVDVAELLRVLRFTVLESPVVPAVPVAPGVVTWPVPVPDFALHRVALGGSAPVPLSPPGPRVVLCTAGKVFADDGQGAVTLAPGQAAIGRAGGGPVVLTGEGEAFVASLGA